MLTRRADWTLSERVTVQCAKNKQGLILTENEPLLEKEAWQRHLRKCFC